MRYSNEIKVGLSIIIAAVIFVLGVRYFEDLPLFKSTYGLTTEMSDAGGLIRGSQVQMRGVRVGAVDEVGLSPRSNRVQVRFHVDEGVTIPQGSVAEIGGFSALGEVRLEVIPGPSTNPPIPEGGEIQSREENTLGNLAARAPELLERVDTLLTNANRFSDDVEPTLVQLQESFQEIERTFGQVGQQTDQLGGRASVTLDEVNRQLRDSGSDFRLTLTSLREATASANTLLQSEQERLQNILANLETFSGTLGQFGEQNRDSLGVAAQSLNQTIRRLNANLATFERVSVSLDSMILRIDRGEGNLGLLLNDEALYRETVSLTRNLNSLVQDLQRNPSRYLRELRLVDVF